FLTGKYTRESLANAKTGDDLSNLRNNLVIGAAANEQNWKILDEVMAIAAETKRSPVQVALNWISQKPGITSPLIGARTKTQLVENLKALEFKLDSVSTPKEAPFPYTVSTLLEGFIGKGIQIPDKFKPVLKMGAQGE
ncbi:9721_t:CDS:2, partial [Dentiscutata heterogama]